tara:strand:- start:41 stop:2581 length:2541 start_codon:yes stop_codon:yes gene_type:complete
MITPTQNSVFHLKKPTPSIFVGLQCREFATTELLYGFVNAKMGIKLRKSKAVKYEDEQTHYKNYIKKMKWVDDEQFVEVNYSHSQHGWGRINANQSLSLSLFHRPTRHAFCTENYIDCDIENCQIQIALEMARQQGIPVDGLEEYCLNPKQARFDIAEHYKLKQIKTAEGVIITPYEQAKKLPIRLAFGGEIAKWKKEYGVEEIADMDLIKKMEATIKRICHFVCRENPQIRADAEIGSVSFREKTDDGKDRAVMALFAQTWERIIQEECIAYLVRNFKQVQLRDIVPSQDGYMILKSQAKGIDFNALFATFTEIIKGKFNMTIRWVTKPFDEAISIHPSKRMPLEICLEDLEKGERRIAEIIAPALRNDLKYYQNGKEKKWYYVNEKGLWTHNTDPNEYFTTKMIQDLIDEEKTRTWNKNKAEFQEDKKKQLAKDEDKLGKHYSKVGNGSYTKQLSKFLAILLADKQFPDKLNKTRGLFIFADGILNLRTGDFRKGFKSQDFLSEPAKPLPKYLSLTYDDNKAKYLRGQLKKILNNNDKQLEYYLSVIGHAMTGDAHLEKAFYYIIDGTTKQSGNNGKTFLFNLLERIFPHLVVLTDSSVLENNNPKAHKNIHDMKGARIVYADEGTKKRTNDKLIKKIGDGLTINNEVMYGTTEQIDVQFKMFVCSNHIPTFEDENEAVFNRFKQIQFCSHFSTERTTDNPAKLEWVGDAGLGDYLSDEYSNEIIDLVLTYAKNYYKKGIPTTPKAFLDAKDKTKLANNEFATWFNDTFEVGEDYKCGRDDAVTKRIGAGATPVKILQEKKEIIGLMAKMEFEYKKDLRIETVEILGKKTEIRGGWMGFRIKED